MPDFKDRIKFSFDNLSSLPWFPDLTGELVEGAWQRLESDLRLTPLNYGTGRVLSSNPQIPLSIVAYLPTYAKRNITPNTISVELVTSNIFRRYQAAGIQFYTTDEIKSTSILNCIKESISILNHVPSLTSTVTALVRSLHVIKPEDENRDVSFSEPHLPFSIFISVYWRRIPADDLRVAEAIVHEAMHLQLTLIEQIVPLVLSSPPKYYSPWRGEYRTAQGILHALYVFKVIDSFLKELNSHSSIFGERSEYIRTRRSQIDEQVKAIQSFQICPELTEEGRHLVRQFFI